MGFEVNEDPVKQADAENRNKPDIVRAAFILAAGFAVAIASIITAGEVNYGDAIREIGLAHEVAAFQNTKLNPYNIVGRWTVDTTTSEVVISFPSQEITADGYTLDKIECQVTRGTALTGGDLITGLWFEPESYTRQFLGRTILVMNLGDFPEGTIVDTKYYRVDVIYYFVDEDGVVRRLSANSGTYWKYIA